MTKITPLFSLVQIVITLLGAVILFNSRNIESAASFFVGGIFVLINVLSWAFLISRLFQKKLIALSATIIVFKYAILGVILYKLLTMPWLDRVWFSVGLGSLLVSVPFYVVFSNNKGASEKGSSEEFKDL